MTDGTLGVIIPAPLANGVPMQKISSKKIKQVIVRLKDGIISWTSRTGSKIPISSIRELRLNQPPDDTYASNRWISIVYVRSAQWKVFHMVALSDEVYSMWVDTLKQLVSETSDRLINDIPASDPDMIWIRQLWPAGAKTVDVDAAMALCKQIGLVVPKTSLRKLSGPIDCGAFRDLIREIQTRPEIDSLYESLACGGVLTREKVEKFLRSTQRVEPGDVFHTFATNDAWNVESLCDFLSSPINVARKPMDMTKPLHDYFISSSHNTYLVGEQWRGESTVEGYIRVLLAKCRCVEIDVHDGEFEPVVYHKKTLTSKVPVRDILRAINKYGFVASPYPVIISAEVHCSSDQQDILGQILRIVFGDRLVTERIDASWDLPSPEALKGRVLFKTKPPAAAAVSPRLDTFPPDSTSSAESDSGISRLARRLSIQSSEKSSFSQSLTDLLVYTAGVKYQGFSKLVEYQPRHQFSVSEKTAARIIKENQADWVKHNFSHISRVYPKGARVNSTNYNPVPLWCAGAQIVAINWQTIDEGSILNQAMFIDSDGYVLKPRALREKIHEPIQTYRLRIEVISAQRLPLSSDLYVEATVDPTDPQRDSTTRRTLAFRGTSLNPLWNESLVFEIRTTRSLLDLTFVHLEIKNKTLLAQWVRPISATPRGYHHLPLYDPLFSRYVFATLFVRVDVDVV